MRSFKKRDALHPLPNNPLRDLITGYFMNDMQFIEMKRKVEFFKIYIIHNIISNFISIVLLSNDYYYIVLLKYHC